MFIEKVTFDSKVLAPFDVKKDEHVNSIVEERGSNVDSNDKEKELKTPLKGDKGKIKQEQDDSGSDEEEEVFKNILSTKGKMASFLQQQNRNSGFNLFVI